MKLFILSVLLFCLTLFVCSLFFPKFNALPADQIPTIGSKNFHPIKDNAPNQNPALQHNPSEDLYIAGESAKLRFTPQTAGPAY